MPLKVRLVPSLGDPHEVLENGLFERPEIVFDSQDPMTELVVGSGPVTGIADASVKPQVLRLGFDEICLSQNQVRASLITQSNPNIFVNGLPWDLGQENMYLGHGDVIALNGHEYEYKVHIETIVLPTCTQLKSTAAGAPSAVTIAGKKRLRVPSTTEKPASFDVQQEQSQPQPKQASDGIILPKKAATGLAGEIQCSVCLEIQVHSRTLHPCGHSFCASCLVKLKDCPECRVSIQSHVPARQLDNLIATLVTVPNLLEAEDVEQYHKRRKNTPKLHTATLVDGTRAKRRRTRATRSISLTQPQPPMMHPHFDTAMAPPFLQRGSMQDVPIGAAAMFHAPQQPPLAIYPPSPTFHPPQGFHSPFGPPPPLPGAPLGIPRRHQRAGSTYQDAISLD